MRPSHLPDPNAILLQLLAELQAYEAHVRGLLRDSQQRHDVVLFGEPSKAMDRMRALAACVPQLSAPWLMVMISHSELMHDLWRAAKGEALDLATQVEDHLAAVTALGVGCRRLLVEGGSVLH